MEHHRDFFRIYVSERNRFEWTVKDDLGKEIHDKRVAYIKMLAKVIKEGIKEGEFKPKDPMDLAHATVVDIFLRGTQQMERRR